VLKIGELAEAAGVSRDTLRYYERLGLLAPAARSEGGYRLYPEAAVRRVAFIRRAQALGLRLEEIRRILEVMDEGARPCAHVRRALEEKLAEVEEKLKALLLLKAELEARLAWARAHPDPACDGRDTCVYLEAR
jgi:DNA-binding transcriptional MerR regulator